MNFVFSEYLKLSLRMSSNDSYHIHYQQALSPMHEYHTFYRDEDGDLWVDNGDSWIDDPYLQYIMELHANALE
jgi:hypothetical protein